MTNDSEKLCLVTLDNGAIPTRILKQVREEVARAVPTLDAGRAYRAEDICAGIWAQLSTQQHKDAGRALKYLASNGMVGLRYLGDDSSHHALYLRID